MNYENMLSSKILSGEFLWLFVSFLILVIGAVIYHFLKSPFHYPYFRESFDVSGKRLPLFDDQLDQYLIDGNFQRILEHNEFIKKWKQLSYQKLSHCLFKKLRLSQLKKSIDDENAYIFELYRTYTRYYQRSYNKIPYSASNVIETRSVSFQYLKDRNEKLKEIGYECTLRSFFAKDQRRLMTPELRRQIMIRDHYTCQKCGKYMPDQVGLHIDHIIPIAKGGKSVYSNLQVLCSKCNGAKSSKTQYT